MFTRRSDPLAFAAILLALVGCATPGPQIRSEYDRSVDLMQYKTFAFFSPLATDKEGYQSVVSTYLKAATQRELEARGLHYDEASPQLRVNFSAKLNEKLRVEQATSPTIGMSVGMGRGYYGYRGGLYGSWPLYTSETRVSSYQEGTLNVDLVDAGIIDPTKVVRVALENAVSVASVLLLTEATMTEIPEARPERGGEPDMPM